MRAVNKIRVILRELSDQKQSRIAVGEDRFGNTHYQYFSFVGLPTTRECEYIDRVDFGKHTDHAFYGWLRKHRDFPPTEEDLQI